MTDHPILFSAPMVRALLNGRKTQTRRVLKPSINEHGRRIWPCYQDGVRVKPMCHPPRISEGPKGSRISPVPIAESDRLWVREKHWAYGRWTDTGRLTSTGKPKLAFKINRSAKNNGVIFNYPTSVEGTRRVEDTDQWHPRLGRFMFRCDSRTTLTVTDVRVQRLQDISKEDALAEGVHPDLCPEVPRIVFADNMPAHLFGMLWESLHGSGAWDANPWVVAYSFEVHRQNIDQMEAAV